MRTTHIGIIGGGQLGMLLVEAAIHFPARTSVYDPNPECSAAHFTDSFTQGAFDDYDALVAFGEQCDVILYELEKVNIEALKELETRGKKVFSSVKSLEWIQDKSVQRRFLKDNGFPVPKFKDVPAAEVNSYAGPFPVVQKWNRGGYDGMGVMIHEDASTIAEAKATDSVFEEKINLKMELSVLVARSPEGQIELYPPTEMVFSEANLVDYLVAPARISDALTEEALELCRNLAEKLDFIGMYAVELFIDQDDTLYVNEVSPRPHNSGHHTISANVTSQYEQQIRLALGMPLGKTTQITPCVLLNLVADDSRGETCYKGLKEAFEIPHTQYTFYGKTEVRPNRKMGHVLVLDEDIDNALKAVSKIRSTLTITSL